MCALGKPVVAMICQGYIMFLKQQTAHHIQGCW